MNIAVVGSGAAAFGTLLKLKENLNKTGDKITVISKDLNYINKIFLDNINKKKIKYKSSSKSGLHSEIRHNFGQSFEGVEIKNSNNVIYDVPYSGGLSDFWSGFAALPMDQNLNKWGLKKGEIDPYYKHIAQKLNLSGEKLNMLERNNFLSTKPNLYVNSPPIKEHSLVSKLINKFNKEANNERFSVHKNYVFLDTKENSSTKCINCQSCFSGCPQDSFFRPSKIINDWIFNKHFDYQNEEVDQIKLINKKYEILTKSKKSIVFDKVFLCAGALNTAKIIIKSFGYPSKNIFLYDIPIKHFPIISMIPKIRIDSGTFGLSSGSGSIILNKDTYYHLLFGQLPKEYFKNKINNKYLSNFFKNIFDTFCLYGTIYGSLDDFYSYQLTEKLDPILVNHDKLKIINSNLNLVIKKLKKILFKKGFLVLNQFSIHGSSSAHYSSNLFDAYNIQINNKGEFNKNLHICDSSTFGYASSSQPHTFFIMANSYRLADNALQI